MKTDEEYADDMDKWLDEYFSAFGMTAPRIRTIIDPSAASFITLLSRRKGYLVSHADNDVRDGIRETATCLRNGRIKISSKCRNLLNEMQGYVWDDSSGEDKPIKVNDHAADALRYFVFTMRIAKINTAYRSPFGG